MPDARMEGLRAAANSLASTLKRFAVLKTRRTADAVHVVFEGAEAVVQAGHEEGGYGWEPIQGLMFDDNKRHPLFGNKRHWYNQGYFPMTQLAVTHGSEAAAEAYADAVLEPMLDEHGFGKYK